MSDYSRLIEILRQLISFRTVTGDAEAAGLCLNYAEAIMDACGMHIDRFSSNGYESIIATSQNTKKPKLLLQAHLDVVPGDDSLFELRREDTRLLGRGTFDMKYAAACFLHLVEELGPELKNHDIGIMFTTDEESTGRDGVKYLLEQGYSCDICVLPDGGDNWRVETAAKGAWQIELLAAGKTAHGSRPWDGDNAAFRMMRFAQEADVLCPVGDHTGTTLVLSKLQAGDAVNQVPDKATASLDIRFLNVQEYLEIKKKVSQLAAKHHVIITDEVYINPIELDVSLPAIQKWESVVSEIRGEDAPDGYALSFGASDARYFHAKGIPAIVTRPDGGGMHGPAEWIDEAGLYQFFQCLKSYAAAVASKPKSTRKPAQPVEPTSS